MYADPYYYPYPSRRHVVFGCQGMVATSQPLAAQAGVHILRNGGNAVDAAVATAACLSVVEPSGNGLGSDAFALIWIKDKLHGLNASGRSPRLLTKDVVAGHESMPINGLIPITVPGAPGAWAALNERFGKLSFEECLAPAIMYAEKGYPVALVTADIWKSTCTRYATYAKQSGDTSVRHWFDAFMPNGQAPQAGDVWRMPEQAATLASIAQTKAKSFYSGELAQKIDAFMQAEGGYLRGEDLQDFTPEWVEPIKMAYRGHDVWEIPPNGHGIVSLMALNILKHFDMQDTDNPQTMHHLMEAIKLAYVDGLAHIADPDHMRVSVEDLLHADFGASRAAIIGKEALDPLPLTPPKGGTVYLSAADNEGNMISYIQSNFHGFGSGIVIPGTGISLQNRGGCFSTDANHPNCVGPQKKPYHTIIPGFVTPHADTKNGLLGPFGMMGGYIQPQGHVMLMHRTLDNGLNPQAALDAPRFRWTKGRTIEVEESFPTALAAALQRKGHDICYGKVDDRDFGRGQIIWKTKEGYIGGTEPRTDGQVAAY